MDCFAKTAYMTGMGLPSNRNYPVYPNPQLIHQAGVPLIPAVGPLIPGKKRWFCVFVCFSDYVDVYCICL